VLEVGCGVEGGLVRALAEAGYDALGVDPRAPLAGSAAGDARPEDRAPDARPGVAQFMRARFEEVELGAFDAVVAGRVLHHVHPLGPGLDRLAAAAPLLLVDEFARDLLDEPAQAWYEGQHRLLRAAGADPPGPPSLDVWRREHPDLHAHGTLLAELRARYDEIALDRVPYLHRWLGGPASEGLEEALTRAGAFPAIGWQWAGSRRAVGPSG
jgi:Methyltransferase domain